MRVKRWLALIPIGFVPILFGVILLVSLRSREFLDDADNLLRANLERFSTSRSAARPNRRCTPCSPLF